MSAVEQAAAALAAATPEMQQPSPHARHINTDEFHTNCERCRNDIANMMRAGVHGNNLVLQLKLVAS